MSVRFPSRWLLAAALLAAGGLTPAGAAQPPELPITPKVNGVPQTVPAMLLPGLLAEPLLLEEEQVSEHGDLPRAMPSAPAPRVLRGCGMPECVLPPEEVTLRCLLFTIHPLAAFLPIARQTWVPSEGYTLPSAQYLEHPPQYLPPDPVWSLPREPATQEARELIPVMPTEVEEIGEMPVEEESELHYELLALPIDCARQIGLPCRPLAEIKVGIRGERTGSLGFGVGVSVGPAPVAPQPPPAPRKDTDGPQVRLDLRLAEVSRSGARKLNLSRAGEENASGWVIEVAGEDRRKVLCAGLNGLRENGRAKILGEPTLVTLNGHQASFATGGEIAIPAPAAASEAAVRFVRFGTCVNCQPTVRDDGTIHLEIAPEISVRCSTAGGTVVPSVSTQSVHTAADIPPGGMLVISGPKAGSNARLVVLVTPTVIRTADDEESVPDLLSKCRRELSRGHYAAAEDLAQQALSRDRAKVAADPLVRESHLLQEVKKHAVLPIGTVAPCDAKGEGGGRVAPGEGKALASPARLAEALMEGFNGAYKEGRYRDAEALAQWALGLDADNAVAAAALCAARTRLRVASGEQPVDGVAPAVSSPTDVPLVVTGVVGEQVPGEAFGRALEAMTRFQGDFKAARYEEARTDALQALTLAPGYAPAGRALYQASAALAGQPHPEPVPQCTFISGLRPALPPIDPAVVSALQKILIEERKRGPAGGAEEAEPRGADGKR